MYGLHVQACLHPSLEQRPSCAELLQYTYFDGIEACFPAEFWAAQVRAQPPTVRCPELLSQMISRVQVSVRGSLRLACVVLAMAMT